MCVAFSVPFVYSGLVSNDTCRGVKSLRLFQFTPERREFRHTGH